QNARGSVGNDAPVDGVEIRPAGPPIMRIAHESYRVIGLELDELEWTRADRMGAHVLCRHVARVHGRHSRSQQHDERRLRFAQMESGLIVIIDRDILEIGVPDAARILAEIVLLAEEAMPRTAYVLR